jgi:hypothetical protein
MGSKRQQQPRQQQPLDRVAPAVMLLLAGVIALMLLLGSQALPKVRTFSWQGKAVASADVAFMMTFTQPVNPESVEQNLKIEPELAGKFSWAGRRMAYTLAVPAPYGETYRISLPQATALNRKSGGASNGQKGFEPFESEFRTRDRVFAYVGAQGEEQGRLVLFNLTHKKKTLLTPVGKTVMDFQAYPGRDRILFLAAENRSDNTIAFPQLYSVSTGLEAEAEAEAPRWQFWQRQRATPAAGQLNLILDNTEYQNLKFDLSLNGEVIVIQRVNQQDPADFGPWVLIEGEAPRKLKTEPGGDFKIAPDSTSLLLQQGKGTAVIALEPELKATQAKESSAANEANKPLDFLPDYGLTLDIANDGSAAALVNFNQDDPAKQFTQSLFWVSNQGEEKPLLQTTGAILSAQFNEDNSILYCLVNRLVEDESAESDPKEKAAEFEDLGEKPYVVVPYLTAINVKTGKEQKLLEMPPQPEITVSLSPDGLAVLFDEALPGNSQQVGSKEAPKTDLSGATHRLWLLPLFSTLEERLNEAPVSLPPTELEIAGRQPMWLP